MQAPPHLEVSRTATTEGTQSSQSTDNLPLGHSCAPGSPLPVMTTSFVSALCCMCRTHIKQPCQPQRHKINFTTIFTELEAQPKQPSSNWEPQYTTVSTQPQVAVQGHSRELPSRLASGAGRVCKVATHAEGGRSSHQNCPGNLHNPTFSKQFPPVRSCPRRPRVGPIIVQEKQCMLARPGEKSTAATRRLITLTGNLANPQTSKPSLRVSEPGMMS